MLINCASQAGRTIMRVTEYGIYYMNRAVSCEKSSDGGLRIREGVTNQYWGEWTRQSKSEKHAKGGLWRYLWEAIAFEDPQSDRVTDRGPLSISRAKGQEEGLGVKVPGEEWGQPGTCRAAQFLTTKIFKG